MPVADRWAVLTPVEFVMTDEYSNLLGQPPLALKDWIKSEIEWLEAETSDFRTASQEAFANSGPLPRAIWFMMARRRRDWAGTPEEMLVALSRFRDQTDPTGWPTPRSRLTDPS
jgi:hypothetical protein